MRRAAPREPDSLDPFELLSLLAGPERAALTLLCGLDLVELSRCGAGELVESHGLPMRAAERLAAAFALGRRVGAWKRAPRASVRSPSRVQRLLEERVRGSERETFFAILLDGKHALRRIEVVSVGTLTTSLVHPREVFRAAVREAAAALVCAHNHPSGDPEPSREDLDVTLRLVEAGKLLGIPLLDHVILGEGRFVSLRERMRF